MKDATLRTLAREWRETRSEEVGARVVVERLRRGELQEGQVAVAALCGNSTAQRVARAEFLGSLPNPTRSIAEWGWAVQDAGGHEAIMRSLLALGRGVSDQIASLLETGDLDRIDRALAASDYWLTLPKTRSKRIATRRFAGLGAPWRLSEQGSSRERLLLYMRFVGQTLTMTRPREAAQRFVPALQTLVLGELLQERCLATLRIEVGDWALGLCDLPRERVLTRYPELGVEPI